ncbi:MAG: DUF86 domain-containing protein [Acidobacteriota bacterium]
MQLNEDLVAARCQEISDSLSRLERFRSVSREAFLTDQDMLDLACYRLLIAIEAALSLCYHVSARRLKKVPEDYAECFECLREGGVISSDLCRRLQQMARFRNLLVHVYWKIDYNQVYDEIQDHLGDLREFAAAIVKLL